MQNLKKEILNFKLEENNDKKDKDKSPEFNDTYKSGLNPNLHKRSTSLIEDDEPVSQRDDFRKSVMSPRMENIINKYYEILEEKETNLKKSIFIANSKSKYVANNSTTSYANESSGYPNQTTNIKFFNNSNIIKKINSQITKAPPNLSSTQKSFNYKPDIPNYNIITNNTHNNSSNILGDNSKRSHYESLKQQPKTTIGSKKNSRKNSIDKSNIKNTNSNNKNLFLVTNTNKIMKASSNTSTNNSSSTLLSGNNKLANFNYMHLELDNIQLGAEKSNILKKGNLNSMAQKSNYHNKMNSEIPVLSSINMNLLQNKNNPLVNLNINSNNINKNFVYNNSNLKYMNSKATTKSIMTTTINNPKEEKTPEKIIKKKVVPVTMPVTHLNSKNNSKNNSKSMSRIEELVDTPNRQKKHYKMSTDFNNKQKSNSLIKKHSPFTSTNSPKNYINKELHSNFKNKYNHEAGVNKIKMTAPATPAEPNKNEKIIVKSLELGSIANKFETKKTSNKMSIEKQESDCKRTTIDYLNISNESVKSTMRESNYYKRECEKVSNYIKQCKSILIM